MAEYSFHVSNGIIETLKVLKSTDIMVLEIFRDIHTKSLFKSKYKHIDQIVQFHYS